MERKLDDSTASRAPPSEIKHDFTRDQKDYIFGLTGCTVNFRSRGKRGKQLFVTGPAEQHERALQMAYDHMAGTAVIGGGVPLNENRVAAGTRRKLLSELQHRHAVKWSDGVGQDNDGEDAEEAAAPAASSGAASSAADTAAVGKPQQKKLPKGGREAAAKAKAAASTQALSAEASTAGQALSTSAVQASGQALSASAGQALSASEGQALSASTGQALSASSSSTGQALSASGGPRVHVVRSTKTEMLLGWLRTGAHKFYALGDKHESISTLEEVEEAWRAVKPMDRDDGYMLVSQVHAIENLQPDDMKRIKREWRDAKKGGRQRGSRDPWPHVGSHPLSLQRLMDSANNRSEMREIFQKDRIFEICTVACLILFFPVQW